MKPLLVNGNYDQAVTLGVHELAQDIATDAGVSLNLDAAAAPAVRYHYEDTPTQGSSWPALVFGGLVLVVIAVVISTGHIGWLFFFLFEMLGSGGRGGGGGFGGGDEGGGGFGGFGGGGSGGGGADF